MPAALPRTIENRLSILACPRCGGELGHGENDLYCPSCAAIYPVKNGKIYFEQPPVIQTQEAGLKERLKRLLGPVYAALLPIVAPVYPFSPRRFVLDHIDPSQKIVVDLGCGTQRVHPDMITVDLFDYANVDIVCSLEHLPFKKESVDAFTSFAVLEHVEDAFAIIRSAKEKTRKGGMSLHLIPFLYHFHESPRDYLRLTHMGMGKLFDGWHIEQLFNATGPVSLFLMHFIEFFAILLSFGKGRVKEALYLGLAAALFWVKYLDVFFVRREAFLSLAPTLCVAARKPD